MPPTGKVSRPPRTTHPRMRRRHTCRLYRGDVSPQSLSTSCVPVPASLEFVQSDGVDIVNQGVDHGDFGRLRGCVCWRPCNCWNRLRRAKIRRGVFVQPPVAASIVVGQSGHPCRRLTSWTTMLVVDRAPSISRAGVLPTQDACKRSPHSSFHAASRAGLPRKTETASRARTPGLAFNRESETGDDVRWMGDVCRS